MIHIVYPHGKRNAAPWSIGNHLAAYLQADGYAVKQYDWRDRVRMDVSDGDIMIGHPCVEPGYAFTDNLFQFAHSRVVAIAPFNGAAEYTERLAAVAAGVDEIFAICGPGHAGKLPPGWRRLDLAIDTDHYPQVKHGFNPVGERKVLYIGHGMDCKGTDMLSEITAMLPDVHFGHVGHDLVPGCHPWGYVELESARGRQLVAEYDVVISCGKADANPTTMLEALAWGLVPMCTCESGWSGGWLHRFPYGDVGEAVRLLTDVLQDEDLKIDRIPLDSYTWRRFYGEIRSVIGDAHHVCSEQDQAPQ